MRARDVPQSLGYVLAEESATFSPQWLAAWAAQPEGLDVSWDCFTSALRDRLLGQFRKSYSAAEAAAPVQREAARKALAVDCLGKFRAALRGGRQADAQVAALEMAIAAFAAGAEKVVNLAEQSSMQELCRAAVRGAALAVAGSTVLPGHPDPDTFHQVLNRIKAALSARAAADKLQPEAAQAALLDWLRTDYPAYLEGLIRAEPQRAVEGGFIYSNPEKVTDNQCCSIS